MKTDNEELKQIKNLLLLAYDPPAKARLTEEEIRKQYITAGLVKVTGLIT